MLHNIYLASNSLRKTGISLACPRSCTNLGPVGRQRDTPSPTPTLLITDNWLPLLDPFPNMNLFSAHKGRNVTAQKKHTVCHVAMETRLLLSEWLNVFHINPLQPSGYYMYHLVQHWIIRSAPHCVFICGSQNKQRLFPYAALTDWFYNRDGVCLLRGTDWVFEYNLRYVPSLILRRLMSYIYGAPILVVSRSHTTTQHSR